MFAAAGEGRRGASRWGRPGARRAPRHGRPDGRRLPRSQASLPGSGSRGWEATPARRCGNDREQACRACARRAAGWCGRRSRRPWWPVPPRPRQARPPRQWPAGRWCARRGRWRRLAAAQRRGAGARGSRARHAQHDVQPPSVPSVPVATVPPVSVAAGAGGITSCLRRKSGRSLLPRGAAGACRWQCCRRRDLGRRGPCRGLRRWGALPGRADLRQAVRAERDSLFL